MRALAVATLLALGTWLALASQAECNITTVNTANGVVMAEEHATRRVVWFHVGDKALLKTLRAGQRVQIDFAAGRVAIGNHPGCCTLLGEETRGSRDRRWRALCCEVTAIDPSAGIVTAKWRSTGRIVKIRLERTQAMRWFSVGQEVDVADAGEGRLTVRLPEPAPISGSRVE